ncbi:hypothetical protein OAF27_02700 [Verrucomicrobiales bacterium]|nr:hypothetical protein [Verrucomicrobiales bacterium]
MIDRRKKATFGIAIAVVSLCVSQPLYAQFGGLLDAYQADDPRYVVSNAVATNSDFVDLLNAQGEAGKVWIGPRVFFDFSNPGGLDSVEFFGCDLDNPKTYEYRLANFVDDPSAFIDELNSQGAQGFEFQATLLLSDGAVGSTQDQAIVFARESGPSQTFEYQLIPTQLSQIAIGTFNEQGAAGFEWFGPLFFGEGENSEFFDFFVRRPGQNEIFSYEQQPTVEGRAGFLAQINSQGAEGDRWKGNFSSDGGTASVFVQNSQERFNYSYSSLEQQDTRSSFLNQVNAQGEAGAYFRGELAFFSDGVSDSKAIYATRTGGGAPARLGGVIVFLRNDELSFTPEEAGDFQLAGSSNLVDYDPVGGIESSSGETITWSIEITSEPKRFFRVERQ